MHGSWRFTLGLGALAGSLQLGACGDYSADPATKGGAGGAGATAGAPATSGSTATAGTAASAGSANATGGGGSGGSGPRPEPPEPSCQDVTACGGDVAGVWFATGSCLPVSGVADIGAFGIGCKEVAASGKLAVTGNWTLGADGKISDNTTTTGDVVLELQPACLNVSGTVTTCDRVGAPLSSAGFSELTCVNSTVAAGGCTCTGKISQMGSMAHVSFNAAKTGKYTTADNKLSVTGGDNVDYDYCVQGEFLTATLKTPNAIGQTNGTVVFQKQP